jgi:hypothetical protein
MIKKRVTYTDFDGEERIDTLYFNLTEPELVRLDVKYEGGLETLVNNLDPEARPDEVLELFETVIRTSYGEKSEDARYFIKDEKATEMFMQSAIYSALFMELIQDADGAAAFVNGLISQTAIAKKNSKVK